MIGELPEKFLYRFEMAQNKLVKNIPIHYNYYNWEVSKFFSAKMTGERR